LFSELNEQSISIRTETWIDDAEVNRARRKVFVNGNEVECSGVDILWRNVVRDVNNLRGGID